MATLRFTSAGPAASTILVVNGGASTGYSLMAQGTDFGSQTWDHKLSGPRGTQGARPAQGVPQNRKVSLPIRVRGTTAMDRNDKIENLLIVLDEMRRFGGQIRWQGNSESYARIFDVMTVAWANSEQEQRFENTLLALIVCQFEVAPFAESDPCDILDDFSLDTVNGGFSADYTADAGALTNVAVSGGVLDASANLATENRLIHTARGYQWGRAWCRLKFSPGSTITSFKAGVITKRVDASNYLEAYIDDNGTNSRLRIDQVVATVRTNLATTNLAARVVSGSVYWVEAYWASNVQVVANFWLSTAGPPAMGKTATSTVNTSSVNAALAAAVIGYPGIVWTPQQTAAYLDDFEVLPFLVSQAPTFVSGPRLLPETVPGDAPATADWWTAIASQSTNPAWAMLGWAPRALTYNYVFNGGFEDDTDGQTPRGWSVAAVTGVTGAATSILADDDTPAQNKFGAFNAIIVTPATANTGASFEIWRTFEAGKTYTASLYASAASSVTNTRIRLGTNGDIASETPAALTTTPTLRTVSWTPTATVNRAWVAFEVTAATGTTMNIDGVQVYEGSTAPTLLTQIEGRGAYPPIGHFPAVNAEFLSGTSWARVTDATNYFEYGFGWEVTAVSATSGEAHWLVDPHLLVPDDYTLGELNVEAWVMVRIASTITGAKLRMEANPRSTLGTNYGSTRYTAEFGSTGTPIATPSAGTQRRFVRGGTLTLPIDRKRPQAWRIKAIANSTGGTGAYGIGYLILVPSRSRCLSASGKPLDTNYPQFFLTTTAAHERLISSTLQGYAVKPGEQPTPDNGLGGSVIEVPSGQVDIANLFTALVPDDPVATSGNDTYGSSTTFWHRFSVTPRWQLVRDS